MKQFRYNFKKQKVVGILNICSLSLSIMVAVIIGLWSINEFTFDNFHRNGERIYRVNQYFELNKERIKAATSFKPLGEIAEKQIPGIESMCRVVKRRDGITIHDRVNFDIPVIITDHNFFTFFSFPLKEGNNKTDFDGPDKVIITESAGKKYFPGENPIGKRIISHGHEFFISGIMYDMPRNSHIQADMVFPLFKQFKTEEWNSSFAYDTYFLLSTNSNIPVIEEQLTFINKSGASSFLKTGYNEVKLEPLKEVHFSKTDSGFENAIKGNKSLLQTFILTAFIILVIGCINFANLFISTSFIRAKSIGIKKSQGASKISLIINFYKETSIYVLISVFIGLILAFLMLPLFNQNVNANIKIDFESPVFYLFSASLIILTILIAGTFPAFRLTRFGIIETLQGKFKGKKISFFQKGLIIIQFMSSICLLIIVFFFDRQIEQLLSQDLGFDNKNIIYVKGWGPFGADYKKLRNEMTREPAIEDVAMKQYSLPLYIGNGIGARNTTGGENILLDLSEVSPNYFDFFKMKFIKGENPFLLESAVNSNYCVLNERAAEVLELENPIDAPFFLMSIGGKLKENDGKPYIVKGIIQDSYVKSLHKEPDPQMYLHLSREDHNPIFFKMKGDPEKAIKTIEEKWNEMLPNVPFEYHFLEDAYNAQYQSEINAKKILGYALVITFVITIAGLFAMAFYTAQQRIKEIGIRKINGATLLDLLLLLNKDILLWVGIAFCPACPAAYFFLRHWLNNFIIKTPLHSWIFLCAGLFSCFIALLSVSYQTWKTAGANPIESLRNE